MTETVKKTNPGKPLTVSVDSKGFLFETGYVFRGLTVSEKDGQWNVILRGTDKKGVAVYIIQTGETIEETVETVLGLAMSKEAHYFWRFDGFAND